MTWRNCCRWNTVTNVPQIRFCTDLQNREIEFDLLPWSQTNKIPIMAYSPVGRSGALLKNRYCKKIGTSHDATPAQIALGLGVAPARSHRHSEGEH